MTSSVAGKLTPLKKSIEVPVPPAAAFRRFTEEMGTWWPLRSHSVGQADAVRVVFEGRRGGRIFEVHRNGTESLWGTVTEWDPTSGVAFTWHPGAPPERSTTVALTFSPRGQGTRVELLHTDWERLGRDASKARRGYPIGWAYMLRLFAGRAHSPLVHGLNGLTWLLLKFRRRAR